MVLTLLAGHAGGRRPRTCKAARIGARRADVPLVDAGSQRQPLAEAGVTRQEAAAAAPGDVRARVGAHARTTAPATVGRRSPGGRRTASRRARDRSDARVGPLAATALPRRSAESLAGSRQRLRG